MSNFSDDKFKLYVSNLSRFFSPEVIEANLRKWFESKGEIKDIYVPKFQPREDDYSDRYQSNNSNQSRGFAFVTMSSQEECDAIIAEFNETIQTINDPEDPSKEDKYPREIRIVMALPQKPRTERFAGANNASNFSRPNKPARSGGGNYNNNDSYSNESEY